MCVTSVGQACAAPASSRVAQNGRQKGTWRYKYTLFISVSNARLDTAVVQRVCVCVCVCVCLCVEARDQAHQESCGRLARSSSQLRPSCPISLFVVSATSTLANALQTPRRGTRRATRKHSACMADLRVNPHKYSPKVLYSDLPEDLIGQKIELRWYVLILTNLSAGTFTAWRAQSRRPFRTQPKDQTTGSFVCASTL